MNILQVTFCLSLVLAVTVQAYFIRHSSPKAGYHSYPKWTFWSYIKYNKGQSSISGSGCNGQECTGKGGSNGSSTVSQLKPLYTLKDIRYALKTHSTEIRAHQEIFWKVMSVYKFLKMRYYNHHHKYSHNYNWNDKFKAYWNRYINTKTNDYPYQMNECNGRWPCTDINTDRTITKPKSIISLEVLESALKTYRVFFGTNPKYFWHVMKSFGTYKTIRQGHKYEWQNSYKYYWNTYVNDAKNVYPFDETHCNGKWPCTDRVSNTTTTLDIGSIHSIADVEAFLTTNRVFIRSNPQYFWTVMTRFSSYMSQSLGISYQWEHSYQYYWNKCVNNKNGDYPFNGDGCNGDPACSSSSSGNILTGENTDSGIMHTIKYVIKTNYIHSLELLENVLKSYSVFFGTNPKYFLQVMKSFETYMTNSQGYEYKWQNSYKYYWNTYVNDVKNVYPFDETHCNGKWPCTDRVINTTTTLDIGTIHSIADVEAFLTTNRVFIRSNPQYFWTVMTRFSSYMSQSLGISYQWEHSYQYYWNKCVNNKNGDYPFNGDGCNGDPACSSSSSGNSWTGGNVGSGSDECDGSGDCGGSDSNGSGGNSGSDSDECDGSGDCGGSDSNGSGGNSGSDSDECDGSGDCGGSDSSGSGRNSGSDSDGCDGSGDCSGSDSSGSGVNSGSNSDGCTTCS